MFLRLPRWYSGKETACQCRICEFDPWVQKIPWTKKWQPSPVFLAGKSQWTEEPGGDYSPQGHKELDLI